MISKKNDIKEVETKPTNPSNWNPEPQNKPIIKVLVLLWIKTETKTQNQTEAEINNPFQNPSIWSSNQNPDFCFTYFKPIRTHLDTHWLQTQLTNSNPFDLLGQWDGQNC